MNDFPPSHIEYNIQENARNLAIQRMRPLEGWCSEEKGGVLFDLIFRTKPATIVEIGVFGGKSLIPMACALQVNRGGKIYGIDPWCAEASLEAVVDTSNRHYWTIVDYQNILSGLEQKIIQYELSSYVELLRTTSEKAPEIYDIDILHIDGNHSEKTSFFDVQKWVPLVRPGGWIIFDDMEWHEEGKPTTQHATQWLDAHCQKFVQFTDIATWGIWIKK